MVSKMRTIYNCCPTRIQWRCREFLAKKKKKKNKIKFEECKNIKRIFERIQ